MRMLWPQPEPSGRHRRRSAGSRKTAAVIESRQRPTWPEGEARGPPGLTETQGEGER